MLQLIKNEVYLFIAGIFVAACKCLYVCHKGTMKAADYWLDKVVLEEVSGHGI